MKRQPTKYIHIPAREDATTDCYTPDRLIWTVVGTVVLGLVVYGIAVVLPL